MAKPFQGPSPIENSRWENLCITRFSIVISANTLLAILPWQSQNLWNLPRQILHKLHTNENLGTLRKLLEDFASLLLPGTRILWFHYLKVVIIWEICRKVLKTSSVQKYMNIIFFFLINESISCFAFICRIQVRSPQWN